MIETIISGVAMVFSIVAFIITFWYNRELSREAIRREKAVFFMERNVEFEGKLAEWPDAFKFYGIDLQEAEKHNISKEQITFLVMSVNSFFARCQFEGISITDAIKKSDYQQRVFSQKETRKAWNYARKCFIVDVRRGIDEYLKEKYSEEYDEI